MYPLIKPRLVAALILNTALISYSCKTMSQIEETPTLSPQLIVLTVFEPFGGRKSNMSAEVAKRIETELTQKSSEAGPAPQVEICLLPVEYDRAALIAQQCLSKLPRTPDLILSLGEGGCEIRLETAANNLDDTPGFPDNKKRIKENIKIIKDAPARIGLRLPMERLYCHMKHASTSEGSDVIGSITPGNFVCNNTAFLLAHNTQFKKIPYGFIHVPHGNCSPEIKNPIRNAEIISAGIRAYLAGQPQITEFPTDLAGLLLYKSKAASSESTCAGDFYWQLESAYRSRLKNSVKTVPASGVSK